MPQEGYILVVQTQPKPPHVWLLFLQAEYKKAKQFCQMERDISVRPTEMTWPVKVDHLSQIFRLDQTEMVCSI